MYLFVVINRQQNEANPLQGFNLSEGMVATVNRDYSIYHHNQVLAKLRIPTDYYALLGVSRSASEKEIQAVYKALRQQDYQKGILNYHLLFLYSLLNTI